MTTSDVPAIGWHDAVAQAVSTHPWLAHLTAIDGTGERGQDPDISHLLARRGLDA